jgi:flagellar basal-body rod modification protein FlgD
MWSSTSQITPTEAFASKSVSSTNSGSNSSSSTKKSGTDLNEFMLMLMAQLKNQNPLEPMKDNEMLGQLAQLNSLNQLTDLNTKMTELISSNQISYASSLVGKTVTAQIGKQDPITGKVTAVSNESGTWTVTIGKQTVPIAYITKVSESDAA